MSAMEPPWRHHLVRFPSSLRAQLALQESVLTSCRWCVAAASCGGPLKRATDRSDGHFHALFLTKTVDFLPKTWRRHPFFLFPKVLAPKKSSHEDFEPRNVFFFFSHDPKMGDMAHFVPWILQGSTWRIRVHCQISTKLHGPCRTSAWRRVLALIKEWGAWGFYGILEPSNLRIVLEWCRIQPGTRKESWRWGTDVLSNGI